MFRISVFFFLLILHAFQAPMSLEFALAMTSSQSIDSATFGEAASRLSPTAWIRKSITVIEEISEEPILCYFFHEFAKDSSDLTGIEASLDRIGIDVNYSHPEGYKKVLPVSLETLRGLDKMPSAWRKSTRIDLREKKVMIQKYLNKYNYQFYLEYQNNRAYLVNNFNPIVRSEYLKNLANIAFILDALPVIDQVSYFLSHWKIRLKDALM